MNEDVWRELVQAGLSPQSPEDDAWLRAILPLIAVSRTSNLGVIRRTVEQFAPDQQPESVLTYMRWIPRLNAYADGLLVWSLENDGYLLRQDIREIILRTLRTDSNFPSFNAFLAELRRGYARDTPARADRHATEMLYHMLRSGEQLIAEQVVATITTLVPDDAIPEFLTRLRDDPELSREALIQELISALENRG